MARKKDPPKPLFRLRGEFHDSLENAILSGLGKRDGRALIISTSAPDDANTFSRWLACGHTPFTINSNNGFDFEQFEDQATIELLQQMRVGLVHGIKDRRGRHDCIYILLGSTDLADGKARDSLRFMLPYIDAAFRQVPPLPEQYFDIGRPTVVNQRLPSDQDFDTQLPVGGLSGREMEIMEWVRMGKTNHEIGIILDISAFTVKNHMQRIFKKLDVMNRAQAVSKVETLSRLMPTK